MSTAMLMPTNGSKPPALSQDWLQLSVQTFFTTFNWNDDLPMVQAIKQTAAQGNGEPLSLTLTVSQFFAAIPWDSVAIAPTQSELLTSTPADQFTLEDFSDLF
jgi:hypothetical protein